MTIPKKPAQRLPRLLSRIFFVVMLQGFFLIMLPGILPAQNTLTKPLLPSRDLITKHLDQIRLYYGLGQFKKVITECEKLEGLDPENKMGRYYYSRARGRLIEMNVIREGDLHAVTVPIRVTPLETP
jgi:hypothetical protein